MNKSGFHPRKAMRKAILSLLMTLAAIIANAQTDDETLLFIYKNGGHFYAFNSFEIDSIVFAIDLGLPSGTKWACCNVGANVPEGYGGYFAWGETEKKEFYNDVTYLYGSGVDSGGDGWYDDYHENGLYGEWQDIGSDIAGTSYDVAHVTWGGGWRMPSLDQMKELLDNCSSSWASFNGVQGRLFKGKNGGSMFLPAAGYRWDDGYFNDGNYGYHGYYWSSKQTYGFDHYYAYHLFIFCGDAYWNGQYSYNRVYGSSVRPVCK